MKITKEPVDAVYRNLMDLAFDACDTFVLIDNKDIYDYGTLVMELLNSSLIEFKIQMGWPGVITEFLLQYNYYKTTDEAKNVIKEASHSLYAWVSPDLPESLSFFKNGRPWLINSARDKQSEFCTSDKNDLRRILDIDGLEVE